MKKIAFVLLIGALALGGCDAFKSKKETKKPGVKERAKADLREENADVDFQAFLGRLRKAVAAHDVNGIAAMMTEDFAYVLGKTTAEDIGKSVLGEHGDVARVKPLGILEIRVALVPLASPPCDIG